MTKAKTQNPDRFKNILDLVRVKVQKFGTFLSGMIMPIIGIIIAWGLLTAFFIPTGWTPVKVINDYIVGNTIKYLIPILIGFLGGRQVYSSRGGFLGAAATLGIIAGATLFENGGFWPVKGTLGPQFLGAMVVGPLSALVLKKIEKLWDGRIKPGFEMLVDNFSLGIVAVASILFSFFCVPWAIFGLTYILGEIVHPLVKYKALPVASLFVEPVKPLFLNNALNHGVFTPLGTMDVMNSGKSALFYLESNPGPGMGLLLAYTVFDKQQRASASSASIIHFFGGIHEVYFPFVIMRPVLIIGTTIGNAVGIAMIQIFGAGAISPASPGSVIALFVVSAHSPMAYAGLAISIVASTLASFLICALIMRVTKKKQLSRNEAIAKMNSLKGKDSKYVKESNISNKEIKSIIFACDAGMGSSAMGAGMLRQMIKENNLNIKVTNSAIRDLGSVSTNLIVVQDSLAQRAKDNNDTEQFIVKNFLDKQQYEVLIERLKSSSEVKVSKGKKVEEKTINLTTLINSKTTKLGVSSKTPEEAIKLAGEILVKNDFVDKKYISSMIKRNADVSVYIGNNVAIPHGQSGTDDLINKSGLSFTTYPEGIDWGGETVYFVIGIAGKGDYHMELISKLAVVLSDPKVTEKIAQAKTLKEFKELMK